MNRNLFEINENNGYVANEDGELKKIIKKNNNYEFKEILYMENYLEMLDNELNNAAKMYERNTYNLKYSRIFNVVAIIISIIMGILLYGTPVKNILLACGIAGGLTKLMTLSLYGSTILNKRRIKKIDKRICELDDIIPKLRNKINDIKKEVHYKAITNEENSFEDDIPSMNYDMKENKCKVRVLKLR